MRKVPCQVCPLRAKVCVADVAVDDLGDFRTHSVSAVYRRRQVLFHEGTPAAGLYVLCNGAVKLYQSDRFGRDHILAIAGPGDVLGELPADPVETYSSSAEAVADSQLCYLPRERLIELIMNIPVVGVRLVAALSKALCTARRKVRTLALKGAEGRLAELLIRLADLSGEDTGGGRTRIELVYSRRELAEMIGVSPETAVRVLGRLKAKDAITTGRHEVIISDPEKLARIADYEAIVGG